MSCPCAVAVSGPLKLQYLRPTSMPMERGAPCELSSTVFQDARRGGNRFLFAGLLKHAEEAGMEHNTIAGLLNTITTMRHTICVEHDVEEAPTTGTVEEKVPTPTGASHLHTARFNPTNINQLEEVFVRYETKRELKALLASMCHRCLGKPTETLGGES